MEKYTVTLKQNYDSIIFTFTTLESAIEFADSILVLGQDVTVKLTKEVVTDGE